jgi:hypothetical protein
MTRLLSALAAILLSACVFGQESQAPDPLFRDNSILQATVTGPLTTLVRERPRDEYLPGVFAYTDSDGNEVELDLEIRARGHFRHQTCDYPPVLLNLKRKQTVGTLFEHQNKLKLVIQCDRSDRYEQAVLREYLAYRILNKLTDKSFRVRLLSVTYVNTEKDKDNEPRYAFLIEHKNRLAERFDLKDLEIEKTSVGALDGPQLNLTSIFEFLIGNTDFSPIAGAPGENCCHNYVLFGQGDVPQWAVPYDFDQSGFVDAPYAGPGPNLRIRDVKQRLYRGRCFNNEHIESSLQAFRANESVIYALVEEQHGLRPYVRKELGRYIEDFYKLINDPRDVERKIVGDCI